MAKKQASSSSAGTLKAAQGRTQTLPGRRIRVIGVPLDLGASRRGVDMGPSAVRVAGLEARLEALGHHVADAGNIRVEIAETQPPGSKNAHYLKEIAETCTRTAEAVIAALEKGMTPLLLGGDHSVAEQGCGAGTAGTRSRCQRAPGGRMDGAARRVAKWGRGDGAAAHRRGRGCEGLSPRTQQNNQARDLALTKGHQAMVELLDEYAQPARE